MLNLKVLLMASVYILGLVGCFLSGLLLSLIFDLIYKRCRKVQQCFYSM